MDGMTGATLLPLVQRYAAPDTAMRMTTALTVARLPCMVGILATSDVCFGATGGSRFVKALPPVAAKRFLQIASRPRRVREDRAEERRAEHRQPLAGTLDVRRAARER